MDVLKTKLLLAAIFLYFFVSSTVFAQDWLTYWYSYSIKNMIKIIIPGVRDEWLGIPNFFYFVVFPFVAAWAVIYGIMEEIQIFRRSTFAHKVVSFVMAAMLLPTGWLLLIVNYFYAFNAWLALMAFGVVFFFGIIFWGYGRGSSVITQGRTERASNLYENKLMKYAKEIEELQYKMIDNPTKWNTPENHLKLQKLKDQKRAVMDAKNAI